MQRITVFMLAVGSILGARAQAAPNRIPTTAPADVRFGRLADTNTVFKGPTFETLDKWKARREWLREQVLVATGLWPEPKRTALNAKVFDKREYDGVTIEKVYFESFPGFYVVGNLYRPLKIEGKIPAVACALGHWEHGRLHQDDSGNYPALGRGLAKLGITVLIYDMTGYNESGQQIDHRINTPALDLWGITNMYLQTWDSIRVIDFLESLPEVDPQRIGMTGASGGGTQTFILYSIEDRIKAAVPVNMISSTMQGGCVCENAPCLRIDANNMEIGAMMAPKPMLMISTSGDWTKNTPKVEFPAIHAVYDLYGAGDKATNAHFGFPHNYNKTSREAMYPFFAKYLLNQSGAGKIEEGDLPKIDPKELAVWTEETAPKNMVKLDELTLQLQAAMREQIPHDPQKRDELKKIVRTGLKHIIGSDWPASGSAQKVTLGTRFDERGLRFVAMKYPNEDEFGVTGPVRLIVRPAGANESNVPVPPSGNSVIVTPFNTGDDAHAVAQRRQTKLEYFTCFNRTDAAEGVFDVLTALAVELPADAPPPAVLIGEGESGPLSLVARALVPDEVARKAQLRTVIDMNGFNMENDADYLKNLNLPHIRRMGGLNAVAAVACNGPIWFHNVGEHFDEAWVKAVGQVNGVEVRVSHEKADAKAINAWLTSNK